MKVEESLSDDAISETPPCSSPCSNITFNDAFTNNAERGFEYKLEHAHQSMIYHLNNFEEKLIDSEHKLERTTETDRKIEQLLSRQLQDGLISNIEYVNLSHTKFLWTSTSCALATHSVGCKTSRRQIISNLVELYSLKEIGREELLDIITEL